MTILLACFRDAGMRNLDIRERDSLFFPFVNRARDPLCDPLCNPLQKREGTGASSSCIDQIENLNIKTEMLMNEELPDQV